MSITGYFNARPAGDTRPKGMFHGIDGETSEAILTNVQEFLKAAGRDYGILRVPAYTLDKFGSFEERGEDILPVASFREVENQFHLARTNDGHIVSPKTVTAQYAPMTLMDVALEVQPWCDAGWLTPDSVYDGKNGSVELLSLRIDAGGNLPNGESWSHHIVFRLPHGVGGKIKGTIMSHRNSCSNIFSSIGRGYEFVITHRISAKMTEEEREQEMAKRAKEALEAWDEVQDYVKKLSARIDLWSNKPVTYAQAETLTETLLDITWLDDPKLSTRKKNTREAILQGFNMPNYGTFGATLYDWMNAVTFINSSPNSNSIKKSKVSAVDRLIRIIDPNGSGYKLEAKAERLAAAFANKN